MNASLFGSIAQGEGGLRNLPSLGELPGRLAGWLHGFFPGVNEGLFRWAACLAVIVIAALLRRPLTNLIFGAVRRIAGKARTGLDEELFSALKSPLGVLLMIWAIFTALSMVELPAALAGEMTRGARIALTAVILWGVWRAGKAGLVHLEAAARSRGLGILAFMPLARKTLATLFAVMAVLVMAPSFGVHIETFLAGLGIGGLAVALAAQDTIANLFGSFVVVLDRPFGVGDTVRIGGSEGTVEDIGLRSTRLRTAERTVIVIPNKMVAGEAITNYSRMPQRRVEQTIRVACGTEPGKMEAVLGDLRGLLRADSGVHPGTVAVNFSALGESSLDVLVVYYTANPDWQRHMEVRERINLGILRAVAARGVAFALPTRRVVQGGAAA